MKLYLKGERCYTPKCAVERRKSAPGQHGMAKKKPSQYAIQLREKQKLRRTYGVTEGQFKLTFVKAEKMKGVAGENFISLLERRLDNVVYRLGFASNRAQARQLVNHGHVTVNGRKVDIASFITRPGDILSMKEKSREIPFIRECAERAKTRLVPRWLEMDPENFAGKVLATPTREDFADIQVNDKLIVEFYSR
jgi:small subunit ribosomal protein S4